MSWPLDHCEREVVYYCIEREAGSSEWNNKDSSSLKWCQGAEHSKQFWVEKKNKKIFCNSKAWSVLFLTKQKEVRFFSGLAESLEESYFFTS